MSVRLFSLLLVLFVLIDVQIALGLRICYVGKYDAASWSSTVQMPDTCNPGQNYCRKVLTKRTNEVQKECVSTSDACSAFPSPAYDCSVCDWDLCNAASSRAVTTYMFFLPVSFITVVLKGNF